MSYKILVADDEAEIRDLLHLYLEKDGYEVVEAADGAQALSALQEASLQKEDIDLVILDIMMPGIDGYRVLRNIRENSNIPVIMLSAKSGDADKILGLDLMIISRNRFSRSRLLPESTPISEDFMLSVPAGRNR